MKINLVFAHKNSWWEEYGIEIEQENKEILKTVIYYHIATDSFQALEPVSKDQFAEIIKKLRAVKKESN